MVAPALLMAGKFGLKALPLLSAAAGAAQKGHRGKPTEADDARARQHLVGFCAAERGVQSTVAERVRRSPIPRVASGRDGGPGAGQRHLGAFLAREGPSRKPRGPVGGRSRGGLAADDCEPVFGNPDLPVHAPMVAYAGRG